MKRRFAEEIKEQILPDGVHYERSMMYHKIILEDLMRVEKALEGSRQIRPHRSTDSSASEKSYKDATRRRFLHLMRVEKALGNRNRSMHRSDKTVHLPELLKVMQRMADAAYSLEERMEKSGRSFSLSCPLPESPLPDTHIHIPEPDADRTG